MFPLSNEEKKLITDDRLEEILEEIDLDEICRSISQWRYHDMCDVAREELIEFANTIWEHK